MPDLAEKTGSAYFNSVKEVSTPQRLWYLYPHKLFILIQNRKKSCFSQPCGKYFRDESAFATASHGRRRGRLGGLRVICEDPPQNLLQIGEEVSAAYLFQSASFISFIQPFKGLGFALRPMLR